MIINTMYQHKRALWNLAASFIRVPRRCNYHFDNKYEACFSSIPERNKDSTTRPGSEGYGGSGISDAPAGGFHGGGTGDLGRGNRTFDGGDRWREDSSARDTANYAAEMAKAGVVGAMETGLKLGEMAKQALDGVWDATKETTESVRDTVADDGRSDDRNNNLNVNRFEGSKNNRIDDVNKERFESKQASDKHVEDLRRLARGYDLKDH